MKPAIQALLGCRSALGSRRASNSNQTAPARAQRMTPAIAPSTAPIRAEHKTFIIAPDREDRLYVESGRNSGQSSRFRPRSPGKTRRITILFQFRVPLLLTPRTRRSRNQKGLERAHNERSEIHSY